MLEILEKRVSKKIVLATMPDDKAPRDWRAPDYYRRVENAARQMPLGILSLATNLNPWHDVKIIDAKSDNLTIEETIQRIEQEKPDVLGLTASSTRAYALTEILKQTSTPYKVVVGSHANELPNLILRQGADAVLTGQLVDLEFRDAVETRQKGIITGKTKFDQVKFPNRTLLDHTTYYSKDFVFFTTENRLHMISSVGCYQHCNFCHMKYHTMQRKNPKATVDEMQHLYNLGARSIHILDDNFDVSAKWLNGLLDEMDKRDFNVEWSGRGEIRMDYQVAKRMSEHGFKRIHVGIEALDDNILTKFFKKNSSVERIYQFCDTMNRANIDVLGFLIVGTPLETDKYLEELPKKIKELGISHPYIQILSPTPHTDYYRDLVAQGVFKRDFWAEYFENPVPDFQIPNPHSSAKLKELQAYVDSVQQDYVLEFKKNKESKTIK